MSETSHIFSTRYPWLDSLLLPLKPLFTHMLAVSLFTNLLALAVPIFTLQVYDRVVAHNAETTLISLSVGVVLALAFDFILKQARSRLLQEAALKIDGLLGRAIYKQFCRLPLMAIESQPSQRWQSMLVDAMNVRAFFSGPTAVMLADAPFVIIYFAVVTIIAPPLAWVLFLIVIAFLILTWYASGNAQVATSREAAKGLSRDGLFAELVAGRGTVKALTIDLAQQPRFEQLHASQIVESYERGTRTDTAMALGYSLTLASTAILVAVGALAIMQRDMTVGALVATTMLTNRIVSPLNQLLSSGKLFTSFRQSLRHLDQYFRLQTEKDGPALERPKAEGKLRVEKLLFSYAPTEAQPMLGPIHFEIPPHCMLGIIGRNGSGKSTLMKLLQGLYTPTEGRVLLDGADIAQFTRSELTHSFGYVPQECVLFSGSIRENIAIAKPGASDAEVLHAAKLAGADSFIIDLPDGYQSQIGEGGYKLSGGQRQRIAIARALLHDPAVLLMDEISSNLDSQAELDLREHLLAMTKNHTIVLATHSIPLLRVCHALMILDRGRLVAIGPTADILPKILGKDVKAQSGGAA